jgi:dihydroorotase-like cyclic amidohydrolase
VTAHDPYGLLVVLAERERRLVDDGRIDELAALAEERAALVATLPSRPPASARPALERAASLQRATTAALQAALLATRREMESVRTRNKAARAYAQAA